MAAIDKSIYESVILEKRGGGKTIDVRLGTMSIDYYEDIFSPTVTATIVLLDNQVVSPNGLNGTGQGVYHDLPIIGGERVLLKVAGNTPSNPGIDYATGDTLYISNIENVISESNRESLVLNLTSREAIINETQIVTKKYPTSSPISVSAQSIINEFLKPTKKIEVDQTINTCGFSGNCRKPFTLLVNLASKSVPEESKKDSTAGFVFFQTIEGLFFKSLDKLMTKGPKGTYTYTQVNRSRLERNNDFNILTYSVERNEQIIENLRLGRYATERIIFDPYTFNVTFKNFDKTDHKTGAPTIVEGSAVIPPVSSYKELPAPQPGDVPYQIVSAPLLDLGKIPSRRLPSICDIGTFDPDVSTEKNAETIKYQAQSLTRYNSLFTQVLSITIPSNTNLKAGDRISCQFPKTTTSKNKGFGGSLSGLYMIKALCHHFDTNGSYTALKLIRSA